MLAIAETVKESEISLWMEDGFHDFAAFNHPRHKIYAYPDSQLIGIVFKRNRLKLLGRPRSK